MTSLEKLPDNYRQIANVNLQKDKKLAVGINLTAGILLILLLLLGNFAFHPISELFDIKDESISFDLIQILVMLVGYLTYIVLHELTHAAAMKLAGGHKMRFGFTGLYAYAGSEQDYFDRTAYIMIALAPLVVWGVILTALLIAFPKWFWVFYFIQVGNITGAAGDVYVTFRTLKMPRDVFVKDTGTEMFFYSAQ